MPKLSKLSESKTVEVAFDVAEGEEAEVLHVTYSRSKMTPAYQRQRETDLSGKAEDVKTLELLLDIVQEWDLTDDAGGKLPITYEVLDTQVPLSVIYKITDALVKDQSPNAPTSDSSEGTF